MTDFFLTFTSGFLAFVSPCILPLLPVYAVYFAGKKNYAKHAGIINAAGFVIGFSLIFVLLGATAGALGSLLSAHKMLLTRISGVILIIFGLSYTGLFALRIPNPASKIKFDAGALTFLSSFIFGMIFSVCWTPCVGSWLTSALVLASNGATIVRGMLLLFAFSLGLGLPFVICTLLIDRVNRFVGFLKRNNRIVSLVSGILLIIFGVAQASGLFVYWESLFI